MTLFAQRRQKATSASEDNPYWMSFSDIMAGLLVIFILACAVLLVQMLELKDRVQDNLEELHKANEVRRDILQDIQRQLKEKGIHVEISDNLSVLRIPDDQLYFDTNSYDIQKIHENTVRDIGRILYDSIKDPERLKYLDTLFVEGHTDKRRSTRLIKGNWGLSAFRAISVWNFWTGQPDYGEALQSLRNKEGKPLFSVSGYAASRMVDPGDSEESQRCNRRIDIRFTTRQPSIETYRGVLDILRKGAR
ncbi:MAG: OmpA family protein [Proteobacteria bacterium]|nr:OmpA family protein [Pseudomonadota bacterium]